MSYDIDALVGLPAKGTTLGGTLAGTFIRSFEPPKVGSGDQAYECGECPVIHVSPKYVPDPEARAFCDPAIIIGHWTALPCLTGFPGAYQIGRDMSSIE